MKISHALALLIVVGLAPYAAAADAPRPNIVILFVDDMGFSDIGCFGGEIETPNLDRLADGGLRLTQFYNTSRCCPSRAALLTGLYSHQAGVGMMVYRDWGDGYRGGLNDRCATFGQVLSRANYQTSMVGKWHAGHMPQHRPEVRGFHKFTGIYTHIDSYWKVLRGCSIYRDGEMLIEPGPDPVNPYQPEKEFYTSDFFTDAAIDYIDQASTDDRPFLLHVCYNVPHFPLEAPDDLIEKYRGRYLKGWDVLRAEKLARMTRMGIVSGDQKLPQVRDTVRRPIPNLPAAMIDEGDILPRWDTLDEASQKELDFRRAMYAAQIDNFDQNVGRIVQHLRDKKILDNTLIMFFSDNGCSGETGHFGMNWGKYRSDNYQQWRKASGWSISQGECWASYSNTPFRKYKRFVHEGGIASPFIAHWPAGIASRGGRSTAAHHLIDIMPTLCELSGATYPTKLDGRDIKPAAGISLVPTFTDPAAKSADRALFWQHENHAAIRRGDWKLVTVMDRDDKAWELYNLSTDRSETDNQIDTHPQVAADLLKQWKAWAARSNVVPFIEQRGTKPEPNRMPQ